MHAEEMLPLVLAVRNGVLLVLTVDDLAHALHEQPFVVMSKQGIPAAAPDDLDDVPSGPMESGFEFLYDLPVAPHRAVQPLQVAVDHEYQVVQLLARRQGNGAKGLGFIRFPVAEKRPDFAAVALLETAVFQVPVEPGLVNGHDGTQAHGGRGEDPEVGHEPRMGV